MTKRKKVAAAVIILAIAFVVYIFFIDARCTVTFNKDMTVEEVKTLSEKYDFFLDGVETRAFDKDGNDVSSVIKFTTYEELQNETDKLAQHLSDSENPATYKGIVALYIMAPRPEINKIRQDEEVYSANIRDIFASEADFGIWPASDRHALLEKNNEHK